MGRGLNDEDLLNPDRVYYRLLRDYSEGHLTQPNLRLWRAVVHEVSRVEGDLEMNPPCPVNSVRARIYSSGLDTNIPTDFLTIFHPLLPGHLSPAIEPGDHVYVVFEDSNFSNGIWVSPIASYSTNLNNSNPDDREFQQRDISAAHEGTSSRNGPSLNPDLQYGGSTVRTTGEQRVVDAVEQRSGESNPWQGKRIIHIGDSMVGGATMENGQRQFQGPCPHQLQRILPQDYGAAYYKAHGRIGWGVNDWLTGRFGGARRGLAIPQPTVSQLISRERADIVLCTLGGNDAGLGESGLASYEEKVRRLWDEMQQVSGFAIWCGPPSVVLRARERNSERGQREGNSRIQEFNEKRNRINDKIRSIVGDRNFIDCREITNTYEGRQGDGIHFQLRAPIGTEWARLFIDKARNL